MRTPWGENIDIENILPEYPRPQMERDSYINLQQFWDYAITETGNFPTASTGNCRPVFAGVRAQRCHALPSSGTNALVQAVVPFAAGL